MNLTEILNLLETTPKEMCSVVEHIHAEAGKPQVTEFRLSDHPFPAEHFANIYEARLKRMTESRGALKIVHGGTNSIRLLRQAQDGKKKVLVGGFETEAAYVVIFVEDTKKSVIAGMVFER